MDMTSGDTAVSWSLSDFDEMTDNEVMDWYKSFVKTLTERNEALERALKDARK